MAGEEVEGWKGGTHQKVTAMRVKVDIEEKVVYLLDEGSLSGREMVRVIREQGFRGPIYLPDWTLAFYAQPQEQPAPVVEKFEPYNEVDHTFGEHINIVCGNGYVMTADLEKFKRVDDEGGIGFKYKGRK